MSSKSERLTYKSYIKINKDFINIINEILKNNVKKTIVELNTIIYEMTISYINILNYWKKNISNLSKITNISLAKKYIINNHIELEKYKKETSEIIIYAKKYDSEVLKIQQKISELLLSDKYCNDWTEYITIIKFQVQLILYKAFTVSCYSEIEVLENLYMINKIYYELFINIENNKITIEDISDKINILTEYIEKINNTYIIFIINKALEYIKFFNVNSIQLIITKFKHFACKESKWTKTWNKTVQKYAILTNIQAKTFEFIFNSIKEIIFLTTYSNIENIIWKEVILECDKLVKEFNNITKEKKIVAQEEFLTVIKKLKEADIKVEEEEAIKKEILKLKTIEETTVITQLKDDIIEAEKAAKEREQIKKEEEKKEKERKRIETEEREKIKKEEEKKEKERKRIEAEERAEKKRAEKLEKHKIFLLKKK
jgi:hypothetical protein